MQRKFMGVPSTFGRHCRSQTDKTRQDIKFHNWPCNSLNEGYRHTYVTAILGRGPERCQCAYAQRTTTKVREANEIDG